MKPINGPYVLKASVIPLAALVYVVASNLLYRSALTHPMAVHFDASGKPNGYLSWSENLEFTVELIVLFAIIDAAVRYSWARSPLRAKFNFLSLVFPEIIALLAWGNYCLLAFNAGGQAAMSRHTLVAALALSAALLYSVWLEHGRVDAARVEQAAARSAAP